MFNAPSRYHAGSKFDVVARGVTRFTTTNPKAVEVIALAKGLALVRWPGFYSGRNNWREWHSPRLELHWRLKRVWHHSLSMTVWSETDGRFTSSIRASFCKFLKAGQMQVEEFAGVAVAAAAYYDATGVRQPIDLPVFPALLRRSLLVSVYHKQMTDGGSTTRFQLDHLRFK